MTPSELLQIARHLAEPDSGRLRQVHLRRATSTTYYALFHCLARSCADAVAGPRNANRRPEWRQAYRALQHGLAKSRCQDRAAISEFPQEVQKFAARFVLMQRKRHLADYDPHAEFGRLEVIEDIDDAAVTIHDYRTTGAAEKRAFAIHVLLPLRSP